MELNSVNPNINNVISKDTYLNTVDKNLSTSQSQETQTTQENSSVFLNIFNDEKRSETSQNLSQLNSSLSTLQTQSSDLQTQKEVLQKMKDLLSQTSFKATDSNMLEKASQQKQNGLNETKDIVSSKASQKEVLQTLKDLLSQTSYDYTDSTILQKNMDESQNGINDSSTQKEQFLSKNSDINLDSSDEVQNALTQIDSALENVENSIKSNKQNQNDVYSSAKEMLDNEYVKNGEKYLEQQTKVGTQISDFSNNSVSFQQGALAATQANVSSETSYRLLT